MAHQEQQAQTVEEDQTCVKRRTCLETERRVHLPQRWEGDTAPWSHPQQCTGRRWAGTQLSTAATHVCGRQAGAPARKSL